MQEKSPSKMLWHTALTGGLILGATLFALDLAAYGAGTESFAFSLIRILLIAFGIHYFGTKLKNLRGPALGFSYGTSFGFVLALMLCAGAIYGTGTFFLQVVIDPVHFEEAYELTLLNSGLDDNFVDQMMELRLSPFFKNPVTFLFNGIFSLVFPGGFIGLVVSAFLKKPADPFAASSPDDYNPQF